MRGMRGFSRDPENLVQNPVIRQVVETARADPVLPELCEKPVSSSSDSRTKTSLQDNDLAPDVPRVQMAGVRKHSRMIPP